MGMNSNFLKTNKQTNKLEDNEEPSTNVNLTQSWLPWKQTRQNIPFQLLFKFSPLILIKQSSPRLWFLFFFNQSLLFSHFSYFLGNQARPNSTKRDRKETKKKEGESTECKAVLLRYSSGGHEFFLQWNKFALTISTDSQHTKTWKFPRSSTRTATKTSVIIRDSI